MVHWITKIMSTTLILIIYIWKNGVKPIKRTYHSVTWLLSNHTIFNRNGYKTINISGRKCVVERRWK